MSNNSNLYYLILAAGKGTRMKSKKSKVLHQIFNTPMLKLLTDEILDNKQEASIITEEKSVEIKNLFKGERHINFITQAERLGTGHAVKLAIDNLDKKLTNKILVILYGDTPFITKDTINKLAEQINNGSDVAVAAFEKDTENQYGKLIINKNKLEKIVEFSDASKEEKKIKLCNSGILAINHTAFHLINKINNNNKKNEYYLTDIINLASEDKYNVSYSIIDEQEVQGINDKADLAHANKYYFEKQRKKALEAGVTIIDPDSVYLSHQVEFGQDVIIEPNVIISGKVKISDNCQIRAFSYLENCHIGSDNIIGPFARIRPGTKTENDVKIGNFVEIKNAKIKNDSKVNHLSYIGDAHIEENVNIGAGTITCNYDGFQKYQTKIESGVFIGSNSALIAPITIAANSIIAAGSTITRDNKEDSITIARAKQQELEGAATKFRNKHKKN